MSLFADIPCAELCYIQHLYLMFFVRRILHLWRSFTDSVCRTLVTAHANELGRTTEQTMAPTVPASDFFEMLFSVSPQPSLASRNGNAR
jgi:hypothetical protein